MREIKFRVWCVDEEEFDYEIVAGNILSAIHGSDDPLSAEEEKSFILQQFTGLKDKNGKEIYEGDYIKNSDGLIMSVKWNQARCCFAASVSTEDGWLNLLKDLIKDFEVVGNVFETPELLKQ